MVHGGSRQKRSEVKKIPTIFRRDSVTHKLTYECVSECLWVFHGEGVPTRKWDGTACMVKDGELYKRYDAKHGKTPPADFLPAQETPDDNTGHWPGWVSCRRENPADKYHFQAFDASLSHLDGINCC